MPLIEAFCGGQPVIVAGSTWEEDEEETGSLCQYASGDPVHPGAA